MQEIWSAFGQSKGTEIEARTLQAGIQRRLKARVVWATY